ncbi:MAG: RsmE family RNA methyltransferase [Candidatus Omnitrophica bacterium]|nr:RsmE family RNA methyltransferase [Candidatus Omnitrophota bacterium]
MNRFLVDKIGVKDKEVILNDPAQLHHLKDVLRIKPFEQVVLFDNSGSEYITVVSEIGLAAARLKIKEKLTPKDSGVSLTVACAIPKKVKMDDIVDKLTQLGVECIIPLETERVIVRLNKQKKTERFRRWNKIALSASKQSQATRLTTVKPVSGLKDMLACVNEFDLRLMPTLEGKRKNIKEAISHGRNTKKIIVLIGPEGDFAPGEISLAEKAGFLPVSLGRRVLRVDTAAVAVASFIKLNETY